MTSVVDIIITMLPNSAVVEDVALGSEGVINAVREGQIFIDMSTISPHTAMKISEAMTEKGVQCLDAPVSGGKFGAKDATLSIMVGGSEDLYNEMLPMLEVMGKTITHCGEAGAGQIVKVCNQIMVGCIEAGMGEALVLGAKAGIDPEVIIKVLCGGYAQSTIMQARGPMIVQGEYKGGATCTMHAKDLGIIMDTARELKVPLPVTAIVQQLIHAMLASGREDYDHYAISTILEDWANTKVSKK